MVFCRERLTSRGLVGSAGVASCEDKRVRAAGMAMADQSPIMAMDMRFLTLEDEAGFINVVVRPHLYRCFLRTIRRAAYLGVQGETPQEPITRRKQTW